MPSTRLRRGAQWLFATSLLAAAAAQAATVHGLRDYLDSLAGTYAAQSPSNLWTFHNGSHAGSLFTTNGSSYRGAVSPQQVGMLVDVGDFPCTSGFCGGAVPAETRATFNGTFLHTGSPEATAVVYNADSALTLDEITLFSEMVQNAHNGNGMDVLVRVITGGGIFDLGSFTVTYANTRTTAIESRFLPALALNAGDKVEIRYDPRGSYLYDHANVDVRITTSARGTGGGPPVPEPATLALAGIGLAMLGLRRRRG